MAMGPVMRRGPTGRIPGKQRTAQRLPFADGVFHLVSVFQPVPVVRFIEDADSCAVNTAAQLEEREQPLKNLNRTTIAQHVVQSIYECMCVDYTLKLWAVNRNEAASAAMHGGGIGARVACFIAAGVFCSENVTVKGL